MVEALKASLGIVTDACEKAGISRQSHYNWLKDDEVYRAEVEAISDMAIDYAETALHERITKGDTTAIIFYLKTKGKRRGYVERTEQDVTGIPAAININVDSKETADVYMELIKGGRAN